jgi:hypothetical protein
MWRLVPPTSASTTSSTAKQHHTARSFNNVLQLYEYLYSTSTPSRSKEDKANVTA